MLTGITNGLHFISSYPSFQLTRVRDLDIAIVAILLDK